MFHGSSTFSKPTTKGSLLSSRSATTKRDSLMAELEREKPDPKQIADPQHSTAKRQQRSNAFTSHMANASLERQLLAAQASKTELEAKLREKDTTVERLERDRRWFAEREEKEREEKLQEQSEREEEQRKADLELRQLRSSLAAVRENLAELEDKHSNLSRSHSQSVASHKSQSSVLARQNAELEKEVGDLKAIAEERGDAIQNLQQQLDDAHATTNSSARSSNENENWSVVRDELQRQAGYLRSLESNNAKLTTELARYKDRHASLEVLREEKRTLESKVAIMEGLREKVAKLEAQVEAARQERKDWQGKQNQRIQYIVTNFHLLGAKSNARMMEEHGANMALLRRREAELSNVDKIASEAREAVDALQAEVQTLKEKVVRREQRAQLAEREARFLQALVASFTSEESAARESPAVDGLSQQRIQHLEQSIADYKSENSRLQRTLDAVEADNAIGGPKRTRKDLVQEIDAQKAAADEATKGLQEAQKDLTRQKDNIEILEQTLFELRGEIGAGNHVPPGMRVLCLRDNPAQQWTDLRQSVMDRLKSENEALIKRLRELESSGAVVDEGRVPRNDLVPRESWDVLDKEKKDLEEVVKQKEKRLLRLQQVFTAKSAEFREAIASILGLKLAFYPNGQVRVTSIYDLSASFVFQPLTKPGENGEGARMQLIAQGEGGPQDLPQLMRFWVNEEQCIPGFLASVTLECYDKSKREAGTES
ncbi:spindle assembly checkpoint component Mad1 [Suillus plorans]|uniref:Spindle assembly checkpoint component MAD1 n=1 Tax=Suillus plorans TaxID=116603 RepID=A0A9P7APN2_9AGAM|nr:spindle assembly checkpoint component Mad1 [Suillus plorans]KAG1792783.1 spindle assembly checkpoint component Mad1 [Suillus plorans]